MSREQKDRFIFVMTVVLMTIYLLWRIFFTLPFGEGVGQTIFGILLIMGEVVTVATTFELYFRKMLAKHAYVERPVIDEADYPHVDVFIATHNESSDILYKTASAMTYLDYPDKSKVHIYLCDDTNRPEVKNLSKELGIGYLTLEENKDAKSGNYNNALAFTSSPLVATFDADMIPRHEFLMETVPYFMLDLYVKEDGVWRRLREDEREGAGAAKRKTYKPGLVQTPQSFYNPDLFQFNLFAENYIPNEQDFFSREVNILRNASNAAAYTGSGAVISRVGLEEIGNFPTNTITEDYEVSIRLQKAGYLTYSTAKPLSTGLAPTTVESMIKQRTRWARGIIQSLQNTHAVFSPELSVGARVSYLTSYLYWWSFFFRFIFILAPIAFALFGFRVVDTTFEQLLIFWLPAYAFYALAMKQLSSHIRTQKWSQTIDTILAPFLVMPVLLETLHIRQTTFKVTEKKKESSTGFQLKYAWVHIVLFLLSVASIINFVSGKYGWALVYSSIIIFWLVYNLNSLLYALFFFFSRHAPRAADRIEGEETVVVGYGTKASAARTKDFSDTGLSFVADEPLPFPGDEPWDLHIVTERYEAALKGKVVSVVQASEDTWRYGMQVEPVSEQDRRDYNEIVYDRAISLPQELNSWVTTYDDFQRNIRARFRKSKAERRKSPRVPLQKGVVFASGRRAVIEDFNYTNAVLSGFVFQDDDGLLVFEGERGDVLEFALVKVLDAQGQRYLYRVANYSELLEKEQLQQALEALSAAADGDA